MLLEMATNPPVVPTDPTAFEVWAQIVLPAIVGFGSLVVAGASWWTSRTATRIAAEATDIAKEAASAEAAREERAYVLEMNRLLSEFVLAISAHIFEVKIALKNTVQLGNGFTIPSPGPAPDDAILIGHLDVARMIAREQDRELLRKLKECLDATAEAPIQIQEHWYLRIVEAVRNWRNGTWSVNGFEGFLRDKPAIIARAAASYRRERDAKRASEPPKSTPSAGSTI